MWCQCVFIKYINEHVNVCPGRRRVRAAQSVCSWPHITSPCMDMWWQPSHVRLHGSIYYTIYVCPSLVLDMSLCFYHSSGHRCVVPQEWRLYSLIWRQDHFILQVFLSFSGLSCCLFSLLHLSLCPPPPYIAFHLIVLLLPIADLADLYFERFNHGSSWLRKGRITSGVSNNVATSDVLTVSLMEMEGKLWKKKSALYHH